MFEDDNFQTILQIKLPFDEYAMMKNCTDITNPPRNYLIHFKPFSIHFASDSLGKVSNEMGENINDKY